MGRSIKIRITKKIFSVAKYMVPGILAAVITAIMFASGASQFITILLFCALVTVVIVMSVQVSDLKAQMLRQDIYNQDQSSIRKRYKQDLKYVNKKLDGLDEKINFVAGAASGEIENLSMSTDAAVHELAKMIAFEIHGPSDDDEGRDPRDDGDLI